MESSTPTNCKEERKSVKFSAIDAVEPGRAVANCEGAETVGGMRSLRSTVCSAHSDNIRPMMSSFGIVSSRNSQRRTSHSIFFGFGCALLDHASSRHAHVAILLSFVVLFVAATRTALFMVIRCIPARHPNLFYLSLADTTVCGCHILLIMRAVKVQSCFSIVVVSFTDAIAALLDLLATTYVVMDDTLCHNSKPYEIIFEVLMLFSSVVCITCQAMVAWRTGQLSKLFRIYRRQTSGTADPVLSQDSLTQATPRWN